MKPADKKEWLLVGLGNPGGQYAMTRHNMGYLIIQALAKHLGWELREEKSLKGFCVKGRVNGVTLHLLLPTTYMNLSGESVRKYIDYYKLSVQHLVVVVDDIHLPFGDLRFRLQGSSGGHNGLKSIEAHLGTREYARLRVGIGKNEGQTSLVGHVLENFTKEECASLTGVIAKTVEYLSGLTKKDII